MQPTKVTNELKVTSSGKYVDFNGKFINVFEALRACYISGTIV